MIFLGNLSVIDANKSLVGLIHNMPFDPVYGFGLSETDLSKIGILVDTIPDPVIPSGQNLNGMYVNPNTKEITYDYI